MIIENAIKEGSEKLKQYNIESALLDSQLLMSETIKKDLGNNLDIRRLIENDNDNN